jgi:hypothetical protein
VNAHTLPEVRVHRLTRLADGLEPQIAAAIHWDAPLVAGKLRRARYAALAEAAPARKPRRKWKYIVIRCSEEDHAKTKAEAAKAKQTITRFIAALVNEAWRARNAPKRAAA